MVSALACALPGSDMVDFRGRLAQVLVSAHDAAQCGHKRKMEAIAFFMLDHQYKQKYRT